MITYLMTVVLVELFVIMAAALIGDFLSHDLEPDVIKLSIGVAVFFSLFPLFYGLLEGEWWIIGAFWLLLFNRLTGLWHARAGREKALFKFTLFAEAGFWILIAFITAKVPIPELGITREVVRAEELWGGGAWISQPQRMIAFGFLYFASVAVAEMILRVRLAPQRELASG